MNAAPQELLKEYVKDLIEWIYQTSLVWWNRVLVKVYEAANTLFFFDPLVDLSNSLTNHIRFT